MIKILDIGNSFSMDALYYLSGIGEADGVAIKAVNLFIPGCSLEKHCNNIESDAPVYLYEENGHMTGDKVSIRQALAADNWDYVVTQQASGSSGLANTFFPYLTEMAAFVRAQAPLTEFLLQETWAYEKNAQQEAFANYGNDQIAMYRALNEAYTDAAKTLGVRLIPCGTVVQKMRDVPPFVVEEGGRSLCRDGMHMDLIYGRYLVAAVWYRFLTGRAVSGNRFVPQMAQLPDLTCEPGILRLLQEKVDAWV